jgi:putative ABC transport system permease protein
VLVLLIACANVSGLLLARGATRHREVALRLALGAASSRVLQQAVIEGIILALVGAAAGLLVAHAGIRALVGLAPALPLVKEATLDLPALTFTIVTALATGIIFGIVRPCRPCEWRPTTCSRKAGRDKPEALVCP